MKMLVAENKNEINIKDLPIEIKDLIVDKLNYDSIHYVL